MGTNIYIYSLAVFLCLFVKFFFRYQIAQQNKNCTPDRSRWSLSPSTLECSNVWSRSQVFSLVSFLQIWQKKIIVIIYHKLRSQRKNGKSIYINIYDSDNQTWSTVTNRFCLSATSDDDIFEQWWMLIIIDNLFIPISKSFHSSEQWVIYNGYQNKYAYTQYTVLERILMKYWGFS